VVVEQTTAFELELLYSCAKENIGSQLRISVSGEQVEAEVTAAHDPKYLPSPDRIQRIEVYEKEWASLALGELTILPGSQRIILKSIQIPGEQVGEIKGLRLKKVISQ
jgi:arylsulfatase A